MDKQLISVQSLKSEDKDIVITMAKLGRMILQDNPKLVDMLAAMFYGIADELAVINNTHRPQDGIIPAHKFKQLALDKVMSKLGYSSGDIPDLCAQGRAFDILDDIESLKKDMPHSMSVSSRRFKK